MTSSNRTCNLLRDYLDQLDPSAPKGEQGYRMMMRRLRDYLAWKAGLHNKPQIQADKETRNVQTTISGENGLSEAMRKKDNDRRARFASRRRIRGGVPGNNTSSRATPAPEQAGIMKSESRMMEEAEQIADL